MLSASSPSFLRPSPRFTGRAFSPAPPRVSYRQPCVSAVYTSTERARPSYLSLAETASCASLYEILGIPMGATSQEIKSAYRKLARVCHPDVAAISRKDSSADEFMRIHAAYSTLSDPEKRADYDRSLFMRQQPIGSYAGISSPTMSGFSGYTRRNWETDQCW
ncbi:hypothetical protein AAG906_015824 [Vitis piasezkii]|uniref:Chaperone protein dnaJ 11, chloroplastic n=1 Tax=Vitis vinifera TaxID=29760 RepID=A0A438EVI6_VITVI|nr:chaperone protein dnaJ 11, chloroplastic [Vitis riparia]RVW51682.1 Chaperone protein dnaJ 11, chloroplastic [Vitis vinifera]